MGFKWLILEPKHVPVDQVAIHMWSLKRHWPTCLPCWVGLNYYRPGPGLRVRGGYILEMHIFSQRYPHFRVSQPSQATPNPSVSF